MQRRPAHNPSGAPLPALRVRVTRPQAEAAQWVSSLQAQGWAAEAHPLLAVCAPLAAAERDALDQWRHRWTKFDAVMWVSPAAVAHFFAEPVAWPNGPSPRAWAPGPGTAQRLRRVFQRVGSAADGAFDRIDAPPSDAPSFDSEHLWPVVAEQMGPGRRLLVVRGQSLGASNRSTAQAAACPNGDQLTNPSASADAAAVGLGGPAKGSGRDWLADQCRLRGAEVHWCLAYERRAPDWSSADRAALAEGATDGSVWLLSSSEALAHLLAACAGEPGPPGWAAARALVTHPRIAQAAQQAGFGHVRLCRPALEDVLQALKWDWNTP